LRGIEENSWEISIDRTSIEHQSNQVETFGLKSKHFQLVEDTVQLVEQCKV